MIKFSFRPGIQTQIHTCRRGPRQSLPTLRGINYPAEVFGKGFGCLCRLTLKCPLYSFAYKQGPYSLFVRLSCDIINHIVYVVNRLKQIANKKVKNNSKKFNKIVDIINGIVYNINS